MTLQINGREVHHETYVMPLLVERDEDGVRTQYENIGFRTWGKNVEVRSISAYRFKLPEKASPTIAGDALAEAGHLQEAITDTARWRPITRKFPRPSPVSRCSRVTSWPTIATIFRTAPPSHRVA